MENNIMEIIQVVTYTRPSVDVEFNPPVFLDFYSDPEIHAYFKETYSDTGLLDANKSSKGNNGRGVLSEDGLSSSMTLCFTSEEARDEYISDSRLYLTDSSSVDAYRTQNNITYTVTVNGVVITQSPN